MFGIRSVKLREKLITRGSDLTLNQAKDIAYMYLNELSTVQLKTMSKEPNGKPSR